MRNNAFDGYSVGSTAVRNLSIPVKSLMTFPPFVQPNKAVAVLAQVNAKNRYIHGSLLPLLNAGIIHWCRREGGPSIKGG